MLITNSVDLDTKRRQALAKVYSLLMKLADEDLQPTQFPEVYGRQAIGAKGNNLEGIPQTVDTEDANHGKKKSIIPTSSR